MDRSIPQSRIDDAWEFLCRSRDGTSFYAEPGAIRSLYDYGWPRDDIVAVLEQVGGDRYPTSNEAWKELTKTLIHQNASIRIKWGGGGPGLENVKVLRIKPRTPRE